MADTFGLLLVVTFDLLSGIIALLVSYYAFQARRVVDSSVLSALSFGFMLLGAGLLVEVAISLSIGLTAVEVSKLRFFELLEDLGYLLLQVVALVIIAVGYWRASYGRREVQTLGISSAGVAVAITAAERSLDKLKPLLVSVFLGLEFVILIILVFVVFQGYLVYSRSRDSSSLFVLLGFSLIFVAHLVVLHSILAISGTEYLIAAAVQFLGFLSLLAFVVKSGRIGST